VLPSKNDFSDIALGDQFLKCYESSNGQLKKMCTHLEFRRINPNHVPNYFAILEELEVRYLKPR